MSISKVRLFAADPVLHDSRQWLGNGTTTSFALGSVPIVEDSLLVYINEVLQTEDTDYVHTSPYANIIFNTAPAEGDVISANWQHALLTNDNISEILETYEDDVLLSAAAALEIIASNQALVQKKIKTLDLQTDGPAVASSLRAHAKQLREEAEEGTSLDIVELNLNKFTYRDILWNSALREG